jgi:thiamine-monophosphate kinase
MQNLMDAELTVQDLGEQGLLRRLLPFCPAAVVGDDGALVAVAAGQSVVVTTDVLVDGVHFSDRTTPPFSVGWRAAAANLSDLAAMGATPLGITVGLSLPGATKISWIEQLYQGITACLNPHDTAIVGGDLCRSSAVTVAIAAFGQVLPSQAIRRHTAQPGDAILVTGVHGASKAGLEILLNPTLGKALGEGDRQLLIQKHQYPQPRLDLLPHLPACRISGMDSSDGLADAILQLCRASGLGAELHRPLIPVPTCFKTWLPEAQALDWMLYGGEDFELVLCLPLVAGRSLVQTLGGDAAIIGTMTQETAVVLTDDCSTIELTLDQGFQHF